MSLKKIKFIFKREVQTFFSSPGAYIIITLFLLLTGWFFFSTFFLAARADMRDFFNLLPIIFSFSIPALTMRLFAEEYRSGSFEITATLPVSLTDIIAGKFLAALFYSVIMLAPTFLYALFIGSMGELDWGPVIGGYIGAILLAAAFTAIGTMTSSLTGNQIISFIVSASICFFLTIISSILILLPSFLTEVLQYLGASFHFGNIAKGVIDSRDLIYFLSVVIIALHGTYLVLKGRN